MNECKNKPITIKTDLSGLFVQRQWIRSDWSHRWFSVIVAQKWEFCNKGESSRHLHSPISTLHFCLTHRCYIDIFVLHSAFYFILHSSLTSDSFVYLKKIINLHTRHTSREESFSQLLLESVIPQASRGAAALYFNLFQFFFRLGLDTQWN